MEKYAAVKEDDEMRMYWVKAKIEADCFGMVCSRLSIMETVHQDKLHGINVCVLASLGNNSDTAEKLSLGQDF